MLKIFLLVLREIGLGQLSLNLQTNQNIIFAITFSAFMIHFVEFQANLFPSVASYR